MVMAYHCHSKKQQQKKIMPGLSLPQNRMHFGAPERGDLFKMATARIRNDEQKQDDDLKNTLLRYVKQNLRRKEIQDFVIIRFQGF